MIRFALLAALGASLAAFAAFWWGMSQRDRARDAEATVAAQDRVVASLNDYAVAVQDIEASLRDGMEALANVPDTDSCGPGVGAALERLRLAPR